MAQPDDSKEQVPFPQLLEQARAGSLDALGKVLEACREVLYRKAQHIGRPRSLRAKYSDSDLLQDTFLEAQRNFTQFTGTTPEEFLAWLSSILFHNAKDVSASFHTAKRDIKREIPLDDEWRGPALRKKLVSGAPSPEMSLRDKERREMIRQAVDQLPVECARIIRMHYPEGRSYEEMAALLHCSVSDAHALMRRAMRQLSKLLPRNFSA